VHYRKWYHSRHTLVKYNRGQKYTGKGFGKSIHRMYSHSIYKYVHSWQDNSGDPVPTHSWLSKNELQAVFHSRRPLQLSQTYLTHRNKHKRNINFTKLRLWLLNWYRKTLHMCKGTVSRMRERYAQTVLTFWITFVFIYLFSDLPVISVKLMASSGFQGSSADLVLELPKVLHARFFSEKVAARFRLTIHYVTDTSLHFWLVLWQAASKLGKF